MSGSMVDWIYTFLSALSDNSMKITVKVEESYKVTQNKTNGRRDNKTRQQKRSKSFGGRPPRSKICAMNLIISEDEMLRGHNPSSLSIDSYL